jgi:hypothetical protein
MQTFDDEASAIAAGWTEFGSRTLGHNYGFSDTNDAEGASGNGEGGGVITRTAPLTYYGDVTVGSKSGLDVDLHATGRLKFQNINFNGDFYLGWFDREAADIFSPRYIGIHVREPSIREDPYAFRIDASVRGGGGDTEQESDTSRTSVPNNTALDFEMDWDADGGVGATEGRLTLIFTDVNNTANTWDSFLDFDGSTSLEGAPVEINAFGLVTANSDAREVSTRFAFDDLNYSHVPEPSSLFLALLGFVGAGISARRRRN